MSTTEKRSRILLVEDDPLVVHSTRRALEANDFVVAGVVAEASRVIPAVQVLEPDVVLMDIGIPGATDGITVAEEILVCEDVPVVFLSGVVDRDVARRAARAGAYGFLGKPASVVSMIASLAMAIARHTEFQSRRDSARILTHVLEDFDASIVLLHADGDVRFMNRAATSLTGWTLTEAKVLRPPWVDQLDPIPMSESAEPMIAIRRRSGESVQCRIRKVATVDGGQLCMLRPGREETVADQQRRR